MAKNNPPLNEFAKPIKVLFEPHPFIFAGNIPETNAMIKMTKINEILMIFIVLASSASVASYAYNTDILL